MSADEVMKKMGYLKNRGSEKHGIGSGSLGKLGSFYVDPLEKKVFYVAMPPTHQLSNEWKPRSEGNCCSEKMPIEDERYWGSSSDLATMRVVDKVLNRLGSKVIVLNITHLSEYRKDGHPSIYRKFWEEQTQEQLSNPASYSDCIHWCLPGVSDVWNELLFQL